MAAVEAGALRPWVNNYPEGIVWDTPIDLTPVFQRVLETCARTPDADALDFLGKKTRYGELAKQINAFSGALQKELGVRKGTRVALLLPNTPFYVIAYYAHPADRRHRRELQPALHGQGAHPHRRQFRRRADDHPRPEATL